MENNYVKVERDENDKRIHRLYLTQKGRETVPKIESVFLELMDIFTKDLSECEKDQTLTVLKKILNALYEEKNKLNSDID